MWFWQHKSEYDHLLSASIVFVCSCIVHSVFLLWFFLLYNHDIVQLMLTVRRNDVPIILASTSGVRADCAHKTVARASGKITSRVGKKKPVDRRTTIAPKTVAKKKQPILKKKVEETTKKSTVEKKQIQAKPVIKQESIKEPEKIINDVPDVVNMDAAATEQGFVDAVLAPYVRELQQEITQHWSPPVGVAADCYCRVRVTVNWQGAIQELKVEESSGVLIYDMMVRNALSQAVLPTWVKGKSLIITFKQENGYA